MSNSGEPKDNLEENKKALKINLSIQWFEDDPLDRRKYLLETTLQTWASSQKNAAKGSLTSEILDMSKDRTAVLVSIKPPPDLSELAALKGQMLQRKDGKTLKVTSVSWDGDEAQTPQDGVRKAPPPPPSEPQHEGAAAKEDACTGPPAAVFMAENEHVVLPADMFLALSYGDSETVRCIEKRNNCVMKAEVKVEFAKGEGEGDPQKALSEFKAYICSLGGPPHSSAVPPGRPHPEELDTQTRIDKEVFSGGKCWGNVPTASWWTSQPTAGDVEMDIDVQVFRGGITIEESYWKLMKTSYSENLLNVQRNFNVRFKADHVCPGQVRIRAAGGRNAALENFAVRALYQLYKSMVNTPLTTNQPAGATGFPGPDPPKNVPKRDRGDPLLNGQSGDHSSVVPPGRPHPEELDRAFSQLHKSRFNTPVTTNQPAGATFFPGPDPPKSVPKRDRGEPLLNGQSGDSGLTKKAMVEAAAGGGGHQEDRCPICLDAFEDKRELACKHEFCHGCLVQSIKNLGPCCPVCKHVFGLMVGNQPEGTMRDIIIPRPLPGFPNCGTILITYDIPNGTQTEKHPSPGKPFQGARRKAYLPNNKEGKEVLQLLQRAFAQRLIFTVGQSRTTSAENQVTWNDIHHKTSMDSGPTGFGYPDPNYLKRVRDELKAKGIE